MQVFLHNLGIAATSWAVIYLLRALPFMLFGRSASADRPWLKTAEKWLSPVVIAFLVVFSYSTLEWRSAWPYVAGAATVAIQLATRSGLVAIFAGTALYMFLVSLQ